jgi:hypothetical protein
VHALANVVRVHRCTERLLCHTCLFCGFAGDIQLRTTSHICVALAILVGIPTLAQASLQVGSLIKLDTTLPGTFGGRFGITDSGSPAGKEFAPFETFCVELGEFVSNGGTYSVAGISNTTVAGNKTLSNKTAWLYTQFRNLTLSNFAYSLTNNATTTNDANALQYGIWTSIGYTNANIDSALGAGTAASYQTLYNAKTWANDYTNDNSWDHTSTFLGDVVVLNLKSGTTNAQDQLALVPEASTIVVWSVLGLIGFVSGRRHRG